MSEEIVISNYINGALVKPHSEKYIDSYNPATGDVFAKVPDSDERDVSDAVKAAISAFKSWSATTANYRSAMLLKIADAIEEKFEKFASMESRDQGKPVSLARRVDIPRVLLNFRFFATAILHEHDEAVSMTTPCTAFNFTVREPVGVAGLISPWNLPLYLLSWKIAPAIAFGNTCVCKPSEFTSVTASMLCEIFKEVDLPPGVVNMVFGYGPTAGEAIVRHPDVKLVSFTGSTTVGCHIQEVTAPFLKKLSLECGGKNAAIIFDDADFENCVETTVTSSFANQGEVCLCTSRIFVKREIFDKFLSKFLEKMKNIVVGDPEDPSSVMGALVSKQHYEKVMGYIKLAESTPGAKLHRVHDLPLKLPEKCKNGNFIAPVVITDVGDDSPFMQEEIFGPVTCIVPFDTEEEVIERANNVTYGLCASIWTQDVSRVQRIARKIEAGNIWVNCWLVRDIRVPFGGLKMSGIGREGQRYSYEFFTETKNVCIKY